VRLQGGERHFKRAGGGTPLDERPSWRREA
jgi:hypothetical protein